jgi:hypothetical protein
VVKLLVLRLLLKTVPASLMSLFLRDREKWVLPDEEEMALFFIS